MFFLLKYSIVYSALALLWKLTYVSYNFPIRSDPMILMFMLLHSFRNYCNMESLGLSLIPPASVMLSTSFTSHYLRDGMLTCWGACPVRTVHRNFVLGIFEFSLWGWEGAFALLHRFGSRVLGLAVRWARG